MNTSEKAVSYVPGTDAYGAPHKVGRDRLGEGLDGTGIGGPYPVTHDEPSPKKEKGGAGE